jgi:glutaminase
MHLGRGRCQPHQIADRGRLAIAIGTTEGIALALGQSGDLFSIFTIVGFLGLTAWLIATGVTLLRPTNA